jgi:hypothetical protein
MTQACGRASSASRPLRAASRWRHGANLDPAAAPPLRTAKRSKNDSDHHRDRPNHPAESGGCDWASPATRPQTVIQGDQHSRNIRS